MSLAPLLDSRRVVLCVGCGGVGKTTTAAALALAGAMAGRRVLCLTVDPARRLAQSMGLVQATREAQVVEPALFEASGLAVPGSLTVMMLDTKRTFDDLVRKHASSPEARDRILNNKLYVHVSTSLAGTQEYMAMEKLHAIRNDPAFDLIVVDTPPTAHALDFLDAPDRMVDALDSATMRWFITAFEASRKLSLNLLTRSAALVLRGIGRLTGGGLLEAMAEFVTDLNDLFGGFKARARDVAAALRGPDVAYVLVTSPEPMSIREVLYFGDRLREQGMRRDAFVVNRVHPSHEGVAGPDAVAAAIGRHGLRLDDDAPERIARAARDEAQRGRRDAENLRLLARAIDGDDPRPLRVDVPSLPYDVHDLRALGEVARVLVGT